MAKSKASGGSRASSDSSVQANRKYRNKVVSGIRQGWTWHSATRQSVIDKAMVRVKGPSGRMRNEYICHDCGNHSLKYDMHHEPPVGPAPEWPPTGNGEWEEYMLKIDCTDETLFLLCIPCHQLRHLKVYNK
jgi:hypothetical protein